MFIDSIPLAVKDYPPKVVEPIQQLGRWGLGLTLILCVIWLVVAGGRFYVTSLRGGDPDIGGASAAVVRNLVGAAIATSSVAIAEAVLVFN